MTGTRVSGHFGELLQGRLGPDGPVVLVSLPCAAHWVDALPADADRFHGLLTEARARTLLSALGLPSPGPTELHATMPRGGGAGASTAALVAYARRAGSRHDPLTLARACIAAEGASDPLMFPDPTRLLWASRQGEVLADLPPLPAFDVIGGFWGPNRRTDPTDDGFPDISDLIAPWIAAAAASDLATLGNLAALSAARTLARRRSPNDPTARLAQALGASGHAIAHTGAARALLFPPGKIPTMATSALVAQGFRRLAVFSAGGQA